MILKLRYHYYSKKPMVDGRTNFSKTDYVEGTFDYDTKKYNRTDPNNYYNVVSDYLSEQGVVNKYAFYVGIVPKKQNN